MCQQTLSAFDEIENREKMQFLAFIKKTKQLEQKLCGCNNDQQVKVFLYKILRKIGILILELLPLNRKFHILRLISKT